MHIKLLNLDLLACFSMKNNYLNKIKITEMFKYVGMGKC